jgi:RimJ/RimL family protein N-acetyltransferase
MNGFAKNWLVRMVDLTHRIARPADVAAIIELMRASIAENMKAFLSASEIEAAKETMGVDQTLIDDETYFVIETVKNEETILLACGGWGKRKTLYGGDHTAGRDDSLSDPNVDAARIRAMYTHPDWIRCGIGTLLLGLGERAARAAGFKTIELGATIPGEPFYLTQGYKEIGRETFAAANGAENVVIKMSKSLTDLPCLKSARLRIDRLKVSDAKEMHHYRSMPEVGRFQTWDVKTEEGAAVYIAGATDIEFGKNGTWFQLAVRDKSSGGLIGDLGLHFLDADGHQVEVGITISPEQQKRGYASEALATVLDYLFVELKFHRVVGSVDRDNRASSYMLQKVGFRKEGHLVQSLFSDGEWVDDVVFGLLSSEWIAKAAELSKGER